MADTFKIIDEIHQKDIENNTSNVTMSLSVVIDAQITPKRGKISLTINKDAVTQLKNGNRTAILVLVNTKEFLKELNMNTEIQVGIDHYKETIKLLKNAIDRENDYLKFLNRHEISNETEIKRTETMIQVYKKKIKEYENE